VGVFYSALHLAAPPPPPPPPTPTSSPYTTLFRSHDRPRHQFLEVEAVRRGELGEPLRRALNQHPVAGLEPRERADALRHAHLSRSEEHTSELQSRENLVCRLLLEKKNGYWRTPAQ